ncbi:centrosome-associated protein Alms1a-like isoform X2 [Toxorhynchites rutilus septentrionalis]|uniref:centrosome-associated protein Alms1a-like isoform X2 n=1 Tax=Toxorhynchites rutilus septentrionalis TaxID=329112 RepID=UPI002479E651|nr:centrosome-associated protein Alms1a-like isoform X2 [Toxorhynchites rutilus septentrionalis]
MTNITKNARITDQIMDYYMRYGQNRDLEKFLRLRASTTRSSSDGSLPAFDELDRRTKLTEKLGKSMENLSTLRNDEQERSKSQERLNASGGSAKSGHSAKDKSSEKEQKDDKQQQAIQSGMVVKETKCERKSGRNFNFNLESVIEIKLPSPQPILQAHVGSPTQGFSAPDRGPVIHEISTAGTQTIPEARSVEQQTEEPIRPILKPTTAPAALNPEETINTTRDISPVSSITSNRQKLEWDSLGDVGYDSNEKFYFCNAADLNETEKRCLQKYFAKKGMDFHEEIVVVKNVQQKTPKKRDEPSKPSQIETGAKQKWQSVFKKYKEKYPDPSDISLSLMKPDAQSTPKPMAMQNIVQRPVKSTQTSLVKILSKSIQAVQVETSDKLIGTETIQPSRSISPCTNKTTSAMEATSNYGEVAASFEFFSSPPSANGSDPRVHQSSGESTVKTSPELTTTSSSAVSSLSSGRQQLSASRTRGKRVGYCFEEELRLGMTLCNTICESRSLPGRVKQSLVDKIFSKMVKNDPKGRTKEELLKDCERWKRRGNGKSGVSGAGEMNAVGKDEGSITIESSKRCETEQQVEGIINVDETPSSLGKEDAISQRLEVLSIRSNEGRNSNGDAKSTTHRKQSTSTSSQQTISSRNGSLHTDAQHSKRTSSSSQERSATSSIHESDKRIQKAMNDYLKPMTHSEVDYANQQELKRSLEQAKKHRKMVTERETASAPTTTTSTVNDRIIQLIRKEKNSQLLKIDKKIEHLKSMKLLLLEEQKTISETERDTRTTYPMDQKSKKSQHFSEEKENYYENANRKVKSAESVRVYASVHGDTASGKSRTDTDCSDATESAWNSHYHMKKMIQNRSKLETPTSDESIATFINNRKMKFIEDYERNRKRMFEDQNHIYTRPYSGRQSKQNHYSRLDEKYSVRRIEKPNQHDMFISSDSISLPAANTLTNTTTHHYDIKSSKSSSEIPSNAKPAATQTTESILRTRPIFETKPKCQSSSVQAAPPVAVGCQCPCNCYCRRRNPEPIKHTEIVNRTQQRQDKQQQTKPNSIAYVITFQGDTHKKNRESQSSSEKEQVYRAGSTDTSASDSRDGQRQVMGKKAADDQFDLLPLEEQFRRSRPNTLSRLKERQKCVNELHRLRSERNKQRKKLLLLTSDESLRRGSAKQSLPPPPLAQKRIFSSRAIRENTRRQVRKFPEVLRKKEIEKINNLKRKNLILRDKFNRNLQRKVLRGHVDLSNSVRLIQE